MSAEENKAIFLRFINELRKGNLDIVDEVSSPDFAFRSPNFPDWPRGLEGARKLAELVLAQSSDVKTKLEDIFAADDKVVLRMTYRGTYTGEVSVYYAQISRKLAPQHGVADNPCASAATTLR